MGDLILIYSCTECIFLNPFLFRILSNRSYDRNYSLIFLRYAHIVYIVRFSFFFHLMLQILSLHFFQQKKFFFSKPYIIPMLIIYCMWKCNHWNNWNTYLMTSFFNRFCSQLESPCSSLLLLPMKQGTVCAPLALSPHTT